MEATAALVAGAPTSTSGGGRLGDGGSDGRGWRIEGVGIEKGVPVAVRVGLGGWKGEPRQPQPSVRRRWKRPRKSAGSAEPPVRRV